MKKKINILLLLLAFCALLPAQQNKKYMNWWYFGYYAGLNFNAMQTVSGVSLPTAVTGPLYTFEGCFTISDANGNLLMSSDGSIVYNKNNAMMDNGNSLMGGGSSTQSGIVVPFPGSSTKFYVVTVAEAMGSNGIRYSVVDMTENGGLGKVITKNASAKPNASYENIAAVPHTNGKDYWLVNRTARTFYVWAITELGFSSTPQTFTQSSLYIGSQPWVGELKFSPSNNFLVSASYYCNSFVYADFNPSTGAISNISQKTGVSGVHTVEFSPNEQYVYFGKTGSGFYKIKHADLVAGNAPTLVTTFGNIINFKRGPDDRIYGIRHGTRHLFVMMNPNDGGTDVRTFNNYLTNNAAEGLPTFPNGVLNAQLLGYAACSTYPSQLEVEIAVSGVDIPATLEWDFGDGSAKVIEAYTGNGTYAQNYTYPASGMYTVVVTPIKADGTRLASIDQEIEVLDCPIRTNRMIRTNLSNSNHE